MTSQQTTPLSDTPTTGAVAREDPFSVRSQSFIAWWSVVLVVVYGCSVGFLQRMLPPPAPSWTTAEVARFYVEHATAIKVGATISSWTGAFMMPLFLVIAMQIWRQEPGRPIWTAMAAFGGCLNTLMLVLPPIFWGVAAFAPERQPDVTAALHHLGVFMFMSTDQWFTFYWLAVIVTCLRPQRAPHSPFPRWFGYFSIFTFATTLPGGLCWLFLSGPLAWNGLFIFWIPVLDFAVWVITMSYLLIRALKLQR